eukprot:768266-Hanusia_phi.AAC.2
MWRDKVWEMEKRVRSQERGGKNGVGRGGGRRWREQEGRWEKISPRGTGDFPSFCSFLPPPRSSPRLPRWPRAPAGQRSPPRLPCSAPRPSPSPCSQPPPLSCCSCSCPPLPSSELPPSCPPPSTLATPNLGSSPASRALPTSTDSPPATSPSSPPLPPSSCAPLLLLSLPCPQRALRPAKAPQACSAALR